ATDYVSKDGLARLPEVIRRALHEKQERHLRRQMEEDLARKVDELARSKADKFLGYASEGAMRMQVLIDDLLAFSRIGRNGFTSRSVDCNAVMEEVLLALASAIQESGAVVTHAELPAVWADRTHVGQVFQNL